jgi:hypothetical protein
MKKSEIAQQIKETEEQLAKLRAELEKPEYPTLAEAKPGDKLENGCIVVHKFSDVKMALIASPKHTEISCHWSKEFLDVFEKLDEKGFNPSQWFIPNEEQLKLAYNNCKERFLACNYWSSTENNFIGFSGVDFNGGYQFTFSSKCFRFRVRAFSLVDY